MGRWSIPVLAAVVLACAGAAGSQPAPHTLPLSSPGLVHTLRATAGLAPAIVGRFREPLAYQRLPSGDALVFDRRGHTVYRVGSRKATVTRLVSIGAEDGRLIQPSAFAAGPDGSFVVADAPNGRERVQMFDAAGMRRSGFSLPGRAAPRVTIGGLSLSGVATLAYTGTSVFISLPETGALVTEFSLTGVPRRSIGRLRTTGHEDDRDVHLALNAGIPLVAPDGGLVFVFLSGVPALRRYDAAGTLLYERLMQGREIDPVVAALPDAWPRRPVDGLTLPLVVPTVRTAALDGRGRVWVSFTIPYTYVFDTLGEKIGTVQFRAGGLLAPSSLSFDPLGRLLATPGCHEFDTAELVGPIAYNGRTNLNGAKFPTEESRRHHSDRALAGCLSCDPAHVGMRRRQLVSDPA